MNILIFGSRIGLGALLLAAMPALSAAQTERPGDVLTYHNDNFRTGQYSDEHELTPANVNAKTFGKLFSVPVDGKVDAQPLFVSDLPIGGTNSRRVVYAATEHDSVYAFNASDGTLYWKKSLLGAGETPSDPVGCTQVIPEIGVTSTPVISRNIGPHGTIYLVAMSKKGSTYYQRIHALDLVTGAEEFGGPVEIEASYPGTGQEINSGGRVIFDPRQHEDRAALLLSRGVVYTSWTSHCDDQPYTGWVIGYDAYTLKQSSVFNLNPNGSEASIWNSGAGPAADNAGDIYLSVANGVFDTTRNTLGFPSRGDYGNTILKLAAQKNARPIQSLIPVDYWTMFNTVDESNNDLDLGSGGIVLLPGLRDASGRFTQLAVAAGKDQNIYVVDRNNLGKFNPKNNSNIYQEIPNALAGKEYGELGWFNGRVYIGAVDDVIKAYDVKDAKLSESPSSRTANSFPFPGTNPVVSGEGTANAILWAFDNGASADNGAMPNVPAILHAYDPANLNVEYYNSSQAENGRDHFGIGNKFITPTIAFGHIYVGTTNSVAVFGLLSDRHR